MGAKHTASAPAKRADQMSERPVSDEDLAQRLAKLETHAALHAEILSFLRMIVDQVKESGTVQLTEAQQGPMDEYLEALERTH